MLSQNIWLKRQRDLKHCLQLRSRNTNLETSDRYLHLSYSSSSHVQFIFTDNVSTIYENTGKVVLNTRPHGLAGYLTDVPCEDLQTYFCDFRLQMQNGPISKRLENFPSIPEGLQQIQQCDILSVQSQQQLQKLLIHMKLNWIYLSM